VNDKSCRKLKSFHIAAIAASVCLIGPIACGDDDTSNPFPDGGSGGASGGSKATGGKTGSGGAKASGGTTGAGGGPATGGTATSGGAGGAANTGGAGDTDGGGQTGGAANTGGATATGGAGPDSGSDAGNPCSGDTNADTANLCLSFNPDVVDFIAGDPALDGKGQVVITVFKTAAPAGAGDVLAQKAYPAAPGVGAASIGVGELPKIGFAGLPETVYVRTVFVDNLAGLASPSGLSYGMFVGGIDLSEGVRPAASGGRPVLRKVDLKKGEETAVAQKLTALRKFTTTVVLKPGLTLADDGQGPLSVGVFQQRSAAGAAIFGGAESACADVTKGPLNVAGFLYGTTIPAGGMDFYFGGQLDDFNKGTVTPPGSIVSFDANQLIPETQTVKVMPNQYSVVNNQVVLTFVLGGSTGFTPFACPVVNPPPTDGGSGDGG
jgi:hypothetical protein